ncbi:MAG: hypothetical protein ACREIT_03255 [Tepidisphaeraceae bacterium]
MIHTRVLTTLLALALAGCAPKGSPTMAEQPAENPEAQVASGQQERADALDQKVGEFSAVARGMDIGTDAAHRASMRRVFAGLAEILPLIEGPRPPGAFRQRVRVIEGAAQQIQTGSLELSAQPTIDSGLRALYNALADTHARQFSDQEPISQALDALRARVDGLDRVRGPLHRQAVAQVVDQVAVVVRGMSSALADRVNEAAQPAVKHSGES